MTILQKLGLIDDWHRQEIPPGAEWQKVMAERLDQADIILLFITPDHLNSVYCYDIQMPRAVTCRQNEDIRYNGLQRTQRRSTIVSARPKKC